MVKQNMNILFGRGSFKTLITQDTFGTSRLSCRGNGIIIGRSRKGCTKLQAKEARGSQGNGKKAGAGEAEKKILDNRKNKLYKP